MSGSDKPKTALDNASSINAFLSKILPVGKPRTVPAQAENVAAKVGELDISEDKATDTKANSTNASALPSTAVSNVASPDSKASDNISPEKISQWVQENAPPDHFKSKNPMVGTVQAQGTPQGSPQAAGVLAPPPTPETVSSQAIGRMIYDELDRIPEDRFMTLGDSKFAPHNQSRLRNTRLASNDQFFSAVPRSTKPRDDPGFTRMSFRAADAPTVPSWFNESKSETKATAAESSLVQGPPSAADLKKENARPSTSKDGWSQTTVNNGPPKVFTPDTTDSQAAASNIKPTRIEELKASKIFTPHTPDSPPVAPHLRPPRVEEVKASKVFTPDTPDDKLDEEESASRGGDAARTPLQELRAQENPFSTTNIPHLPKEDSKGRSAKEAAVAKPVINVKTTNLAPEESSNPSAGPLTPSSMTFTAVSPTKVRAAGITTAVQPAKIVGDNLEGALYFKAWPTQPKSDERASRSGKPLFPHFAMKPSNA